MGSVITRPLKRTLRNAMGRRTGEPTPFLAIDARRPRAHNAPPNGWRRRTRLTGIVSPGGGVLRRRRSALSRTAPAGPRRQAARPLRRPLEPRLPAVGAAAGL